MSKLCARTGKTLSLLFSLSLLLLVFPVARLQAQTPTAVPTWRYDNTHAGANVTETLLTPANVNTGTFGKLFSLPVDGLTYAQPLYIPSLTMSDGLVHNVLFVATSHDSVYAFDADSNGGANSAPLWHINLLTPAYGAQPGETTVPYSASGSPDVGENGVTGTPAINPATNTMYLVAASTLNGVYYFRVHGINLITGAEQASGPGLVTATVAGTGKDSTGGQLAFDPILENQRTAVNYYNGYVYFGFAAHGDNGYWHGWLFAYNAATLQQTAAIAHCPDGFGGGIWASGAGMPIDGGGPGGSGRMFVAVGNGTFGTANTLTPEVGESVVQYNLANGGLTPSDIFTSFNANLLNTHDTDLGSGGLLMLPDELGSYTHELVQVGKEGRIEVLNRDGLGGFAGTTATSNTNILQDITGVLALPAGAPATKPAGLWNTPAYWHGRVYMWGNEQWPMMFSMGNGVLSTTPISQATSVTSHFPTPSFSISANGYNDGIAWASRNDQFNTDGPAVLYAWDATDLTKLLYESDTNPERDSAGPANKNAIPIVTNGKVYLATHGEVDVYGLLNGTPVTVAPVISPNGGTFPTAQSVTLASTTATASIYYTLDGTVPTPGSTLYTGPISISTDTTVNAVASAPGFVQSGVSSATFTFTSQAPAPTFLPAAGTYNSAQQITLADTDAAAAIYYTIDGSTPTAASTLYTGPITVAVSLTINAIAIDPAVTNSNVASAAYVIEAGGSQINFANGFSVTTGLTLNGTTAVDDTRLQLTDGGTNEAGSVFWNTPINVQAFTTNFSFQLSSPTPAQMGNGFTFTLQNSAATALGGDSAGLGYQDIPKSVAVKFNFYNYENEGSDSTGIYMNGQPPVNPTVDISSSGLVLNSGDNINAQIVYDGTTLTLTLADTLANKNFTYSWPISIPQVIGSNTAFVGFTGGAGGLSASQKLLTWTYLTQSLPTAFSVTPGTYTTAQNVSLASGTPDATIYYTTDGTPPSAGSIAYSTPVAVTNSETIQAVAISPTVGTSVISTGAYVIQAAATPGYALTGTTPAAVAAGGTATSTISVTPNNGFTGNVTLTCAVTSSPAGAAGTPTCAVTQPAAITGTGGVMAALSVTTQAATTAGSYTVTVTGASGSLSQATAVPIVVSSPAVGPSFTLTGTAVSVDAGMNGTSTVTVAPAGGFTGTVSLTCAVSGPAGATGLPACSATQPVTISGTQSGTAPITLSTQAATTAGVYIVTVTGTSGTLSQTGTLSLTVAPASITPTPSFMLTGTAVSVSAGTNATSTVTVTPAGGFAGSVNLACTVTGPAGATSVPTCSATQPAAIAGNQAVTTTLTVNSTATTTTGAYTVAVTGTATGLTETASVAVTVTPALVAPSFTLAGTAITVAALGTPVNSTLTITPAGGFSGSVALACSVTSSPAGATALPTCSVAQSMAVAGTAVTTTVTVNTTASSTAAMHDPLRQIFGLGGLGGGTMAALALCVVPFRRRKWQTTVGLVLLFAAAMGGMGCGGGSSSSTPPPNSGTTPGAYTVTVTGTSGTISQTAQVAVTVQ